MSFNTSVNYVVYDLRSYFSRQPGDIRLCPRCENNISVFNLTPSKAVTDCLAGAIIPSHEFSVLYECKGCHWWAIRESWGDREYSDGPDCLVVVNEESVSDSSETPHQGALPWTQALEDEYLYEKMLPLPDSVGRLFAEHRVRT
jgi:hypothetical protein